MTEHDQLMLDALQMRFAHLGQVETYTPADDSDPVTATVIVGAEGDELLELTGERQSYRHRVIEVLTADIAHPGRPDTVTVTADNLATETWTVHAVEFLRRGAAGLRVILPVRVPYEGRRMQGKGT